jgi:hypothetical protein
MSNNEPQSNASGGASALTAGLGAWVDSRDRAPTVKPGNNKEFIVACRRAHNGKTYVFAADYLNAKLLFTDEDDCPEDGKPFTGWYYEMADDGDYETAWHSVCSQDGDEITHWMEMPAAPNNAVEELAALKQPAQEPVLWPNISWEPVGEQK